MKPNKLIAIILIAFLSFLVLNKGIAQKSYYVSSTDGDDSYDGLCATYSGMHGPWKSLDKVANTDFNPSDSILLKRGDAWNEQLYVKKSGNSSANIYYGDYGSGYKPIINCADTIKGWTKYSDNIWAARLDTGITSVSQIFMNGERLVVARWPNRGWNTIDSILTTGYYLYDQSLTQSDDYWVGATMEIRDCNWRIESRKITRSSVLKKTISWDKALKLSFKAKIGYGYYIENKFALVDTTGEWYFDADTHILYLQVAPVANPNNDVVEASVLEEGIYVKRKNYITISNLDVRNAGYRGVFCTGNYVNLTDIEVYNSFYNGIHCVYGTNCTIASNRIENNDYGYGILVTGMSCCNIIDNVITNIGSDTASYKAGTGMYINGSSGNSVITGNLISNTAWSGLYIGALELYY